MASAIGTALISTSLSFMVDKAMGIIKDNGKKIVKYIADKAVDKATDKVMDTPMDRAMDFIKDKGKAIVRFREDKAMDKATDKPIAMVVDKIQREISNLQKTLCMIEGTVQVAEEKQIDDVFIRNWLHDLVDIGYEARDVLDDFIIFSSCVITTEESSNPVNFNSSVMLCYFGGLSSDTSKLPLAILNRLEEDFRSVREKFDEKKKEGETFTNLRSVVGGGGSESIREHRRPIVGPSINKQRDGLFLGREEVKQEIMEKILHPSGDHVDVVVIWGMGGIGKTTLAQSIYNDKSVKEVPRSWLCVGVNKFRAEMVIKEIVNDKETIGIENLQKKLKEKFEGNRFLIVLDDVWDVDGSEWDLLFNPLTGVGKGGLIIITRRERQLCDEITSQTTYNLRPLSKEDSWSIFESCAYVNGKANSTPDLKRIGEEIVKKLNGLPLALKVVGRSLLNKDSTTWTNFLESKFTKDEVMSALRWSYNHLPRHLKTCFTYCALFPKGHAFDNEKVLVEMWMAHDLIQNEDVGAQYFEQLLNASLLQCVDRMYVMHDLIHDLALLVSNEEFATANSSLTNDQMENVRHITITPGEYSKIPRLRKMEKLLTFYSTYMFSLIDDETEKYVLDVFNQLKSIRVLVLVSWKITDIPDCISELRHLRYLDVSQTGVKSLPDSLCRLYNLQMLAARLDATLPRDIVKMVNLRYVRANLSTCKAVGKLTSLQELSSICVCQGDNIRELGDMQILRGRLSIEGLENVTSSEDAAGALMEKQILMDGLELTFHQQLEKSTISEKVLDSLRCPPNLTYLKIFGYSGVKSPSWMVDGKHKFGKLHTLKLSRCLKLESLPPLGELTSLKHLFLMNVGIKRLGDEFYGTFTHGKDFFPSLELLGFDEMEEWEEWDDIIIENTNVSFFPRLIELEIKHCSKLVSVLPVVKNCTSKRKREDKHCIINASKFMTSLCCLKIHNCDGLKRLQLDAFVSLKDLEISNCSSLVQITSAICKSPVISSYRPLMKMDFVRCDGHDVINILMLRDFKSLRSLNIDTHRLDSLEHLKITGCPKLELAFEDGSSSSSSGNSVAVPIDNFSTDSTQVSRQILFNHEFIPMQSLKINNLGEFENFGETVANKFCDFRFLKGLHISLCKYLKSLPAYFYKLSSLKSLSIIYCPQLQSLPSDFHKLSSLERLHIYVCLQLQSLPADGFPPSLTYLRIICCPLLYKRCKDESGLDWHKIKHIRDRQIRRRY